MTTCTSLYLLTMLLSPFDLLLSFPKMFLNKFFNENAYQGYFHYLMRLHLALAVKKIKIINKIIDRIKE